METFFSFTDECGQYRKERSEKFKAAHPFYVRSTIIMSAEDYLHFQRGFETLKETFNVPVTTEIKWSHYGSILKNNRKKIQHSLSVEQLKNFYSQALKKLCELPSVTIYYTLTDNAQVARINEIALLKMHLQNALQRIQTVSSKQQGFAILIADDFNDKNTPLKEVVYQMTMEGDYTKYDNVKKGIYIDFSNQCPGLQIADICTGVFTASLKHLSVSSDSDKNKYQCGYNLFFSDLYSKTRCNSYRFPYSEVYTYGIKEIPNGAGTTLAKKMSGIIEEKLLKNFEIEMSMYDNN